MMNQSQTRHLFALFLMASILSFEKKVHGGEGPESDFGISCNDLLKKLRISEQRIRSLGVSIKGNKKSLYSRRAAENGDIPAVASQFRFLQNWEVDSLGRGWNNCSGKSVLERVDGTFFDIETKFESTCDGEIAKMVRTEKYAEGKKRQVGMMQSTLAWSQHSPFTFTLGRTGYTASSLIESRNGRIIERRKWQGYPILVVQIDPQNLNYKYLKKQKSIQFWVDIERFIVLRWIGIERDDETKNWSESSQLNTYGHVQIKPGIWLPTKVERVEEQLSPVDTAVTYELQCSNWKVNTVIPKSKMHMQFPKGVQIGDLRRKLPTKNKD